MSDGPSGNHIDELAAELKETADRSYVRTFLFSMRIGAPLTNLHVITKFIGIVLLSFALVRVMSERDPDPVMALGLLILALATMYLGGVTRWLFQSYMLIVFPMFAFLFITWLAFTPTPGARTYLQMPVYSGEVQIGISAALVIFALTVVGHFILTRKLLRGVFLGFIAGFILANLTSNPSVQFASYDFLQPYSFIVSDQNLLIAGTKVLGYAAMVFITLMFVMTTRDSELVGALRQLRVPYLIRFFLSVFFRTLQLSLLDFQTIRQAQIARGVNVKKRTIFGVLRDMALISVPLVATMLQRSTDIGDALLARGFSLDQPGQEYVETLSFSLTDLVAFLLIGGLMVTIFGYSLNLYALFQVAGR